MRMESAFVQAGEEGQEGGGEERRWSADGKFLWSRLRLLFGNKGIGLEWRTAFVY